MIVDEILVASVVIPVAECSQILGSSKSEGRNRVGLVNVEKARSSTGFCCVVLARHFASRDVDRRAVRRKSDSSPTFSII